MAKYSFEFKMMVVNEYLNGQGGYTYLGDKYGINRCLVQRWIYTYNSITLEEQDASFIYTACGAGLFD